MKMDTERRKNDLWNSGGEVQHTNIIWTHVRMGESELTRYTTVACIDAQHVRGWPPVKWENNVLKHMRERIRTCENEVQRQMKTNFSAVVTHYRSSKELVLV